MCVIAFTIDQKAFLIRDRSKRLPFLREPEISFSDQVNLVSDRSMLDKLLLCDPRPEKPVNQ